MQLMDRALQLGVNTSFIELNALSNSAAETIKVLTAVLSCFRLSGTIDPQLSLYSLKPPNATFFIDFKLPLQFSNLCSGILNFWQTEYPLEKAILTDLSILTILLKIWVICLLKADNQLVTQMRNLIENLKMRVKLYDNCFIFPIIFIRQLVREILWYRIYSKESNSTFKVWTLKSPMSSMAKEFCLPFLHPLGQTLMTSINTVDKKYIFLNIHLHGCLDISLLHRKLLSCWFIRITVNILWNPNRCALFHKHCKKELFWNVGINTILYK